MPQPLRLCSSQGVIIRPSMSRGPKGGFVLFKTDHGTELWELPEGVQSRTGWNEWRVWPARVYGGRRGDALGEPWTYWWRGVWPKFLETPPARHDARILRFAD